MSWAFQSAGAVANSITPNTSPYNVAYPSSISAGNILLVGVVHDNSAATFTLSDGGFVSVASANSDGVVAIYAKIASGSETGNFTVGASVNGQSFAQCARFTGGPSSLTGILDASIAHGAGSGASTFAWNALTVPTSNDLIIGIAIGEALTGSVTGNVDNPAPWTAAIGTAHNSFSCFTWNYEVQTTATNISSGVWTPSGSSTNYFYQTLLAAFKTGASFGLTAASGSYGLSGESTNFPATGAYTLLAAAGAYDFIGAPGYQGYGLFPSTGLYGLTGEAVGTTPVVLPAGLYGYTGFPVTFTVLGQNLMPSVLGLTYYAASFAIVNAGLVQTGPPSVVLQKGVNAGIVIGQYPPPGTSVAAGTEVMLTVAAGSNLLSVTFDLFQLQFGQLL